MIKFTLPPTQQIYSLFKTKGGRAAEVLFVRVNQLMHQLASRVVTEKLSGNPLHRRTGVLAGSVHATETTISATKISGAVEAASGPAFYGVAHEYGTTGPYEITAVRARALQFVVGGREVYAKSVMHPAMPQRAFMRPTEVESADWIRNELEAALGEEMQKS
jgi:hypothetical protein